MKSSGINTEIFKSHSTRHASTSAAYRAGMNIKAIKNSAGWIQKSEAFARFYNRPLQNENNLLEVITNNS